MPKLNYRRWITISAVLLFGILVIIMMLLSSAPKSSSTNNKVNVVAAENFWGSLVAQIGGNKINLKVLITDPNADPHEYESSTNDARLFASANYVILNGAGYDSWGNKLLSASPSQGRKVLMVSTLLGKKEGDNPHFWFSPSYVNQVIYQMKQDLSALDPKNSSYYAQQYALLKTKLALYQNQILDIKAPYSGTKVAATEDIFVYLAQAAGLNLISPLTFMQAVAEGNDPPSNSVVQFEQQLKSGQVKLLVYNRQTITPLTNSMKQLAITNNIPLIPVSETIEPTNLSFEAWMGGIIQQLQSALSAQVKP